MFNRTRCLQIAAAVASISLLAGCGLFADDGDAAAKRITVGTMSAPSTLDPAAAWDGSWELYRNVYQTLLAFPTGSTKPQPDAAQNCEFTDAANTAYRCTLRKGLKFSDGEVLDAKAVKHSLDRIRTINHKSGPAGLFNSLDKIEAPDALTVVFHLKTPDATFPYVLGSPAASLVAPKEYPANKVRQDNKVIGSGPYVLTSYTEGGEAVLGRNESYTGFANRQNDGVTIRYFADSKKMIAALKGKEIDATYRGLSAAEIKDLQTPASHAQGVQVVENVGAEIRYLVFNPSDPQVNKPAVRQAIAQVIDRGAIVSKVYQGTAEPLYSMVPKGVVGHKTPFYDIYGNPDVAKAKKILTTAGITQKVELTFWYTTDRYGASTADEFTEIKRQLEESELFKINLRGQPWKTFQEGYQNGQYPVFGRGWFPDFPDPDNFIAPFVGKENAVGTPYEPAKIQTELLPKSRREGDRSAGVREFEEAQQIFAQDVRLLPLWQGKLYVGAREDIAGAERALDPQTAMQMWELRRKTSW
ncbi:MULTISPECIES: ABC transporter substrate-binding protein [Streptomyces]|uniref:ABC transporter substrate-binding protein n=1 Tax=Streptomyces katrae TaxID=68223 RepID=A0ABT7H4P2_9ACTN|nr:MULTISPECIES: ABC transporter substrate-binding protein [Streptomyces]MDK9500526.1 ABC transporter substrate-binding protein [Streptomyces katrae]RSS99116.1 peptide-binding protein [Streptomyces sp. WAC07149]GLX16388.1 solute-binding transport lipoprotein [Streptomyces lavendulae subsp. lavendulae]GLX25008.1 solute-binding transport lipoprotein [Streptomyces lavendulae subsp. lavendulae]